MFPSNINGSSILTRHNSPWKILNISLISQHVLFSVSVAKLSKINDNDSDKDFDNGRD